MSEAGWDETWSDLDDLKIIPYLTKRGQCD
jgi:hypothetical protein